jgi:predicted transcriptional regulator
MSDQPIYITPHLLAAYADQLLKEQKVSRAEAGRALGIPKANVSDALNDPGTKRFTVVRQIIERYSDKVVRGPFYAVEDREAAEEREKLDLDYLPDADDTL